MRLKNLLPFVFILLTILTGCSKDPSPGQPDPPPGNTSHAMITTGAATNIKLDSATISGTIVLNGDSPILESGVCYAVTATPVITGTKVINTVADGAFSCTLTHLDPSKTYYARAYLKNAAGTVYGNEVSFVSARYPLVSGNGYFNDKISTLCTDPSGNVYAGGYFWQSGSGASWAYVAKYDGTSWSNPGNLQSGAEIRSICSNASGNIFAGIRRFNTGVEYYVGKLTGNTWTDVGIYNSNNFLITQTCTDVSNNVYAIGTMQNSSGKYYVAKWGPAGYSQLGNFDDYPLSICTDVSGNVYVAGLFNHGSGFDHFYVAKWNGTTWTELGDFNDVITSLAIDGSGNLLVTGAFRNASGQYYMAKWNGTGFSQVGNLHLVYDYYASNYIDKMIVDHAGNIYAVGGFKNAAGRYYILKWDGNDWTEFIDFNGQIFAICADATGKIYAGGNFKASNGLWYVASCN